MSLATSKSCQHSLTQEDVLRLYTHAPLHRGTVPKNRVATCTAISSDVRHLVTIAIGTQKGLIPGASIDEVHPAILRMTLGNLQPVPYDVMAEIMHFLPVHDVVKNLGLVSWGVRQQVIGVNDAGSFWGSQILTASSFGERVQSKGYRSQIGYSRETLERLDRVAKQMESGKEAPFSLGEDLAATDQLQACCCFAVFRYCYDDRTERRSRVEESISSINRKHVARVTPLEEQMEELARKNNAFTVALMIASAVMCMYFSIVQPIAWLTAAPGLWMAESLAIPICGVDDTASFKQRVTSAAAITFVLSSSTWMLCGEHHLPKWSPPNRQVLLCSWSSWCTPHK